VDLARRLQVLLWGQAFPGFPALCGRRSHEIPRRTLFELGAAHMVGSLSCGEDGSYKLATSLFQFLTAGWALMAVSVI